MKWLIKNPTPKGDKQKKWGDYHIGRCLTKYLNRVGEDVETHYKQDWDKNSQCDILLFFRGRYPYIPKEDNCIKIMWNFGHPNDVTIEEYNSYDLIFVASNSYTKVLKGKLDKPVYPLLLCTDPEEFYNLNPKKDLSRKGIIFVGNTRGVMRPGIIWATKYIPSIKIWGRDWDKYINKKYVKGSYYPNEKLAKLYSESKATLNNHWPDMIKYGFVNNRVYDALACGLPIISDYNKELYDLFPNEILYYKNEQEFKKCINELNTDYLEIKKRVNGVIPRIKEEFSYEARVKDLLNIINEHLK